MPKSFKELGKRADELIEQGNRASNEVQNHQARVSTLASRVSSARMQFENASELDEEGNPVGDVESARAELSIAERLLEVEQQALESAKSDVSHNISQKNAHVSTIANHNKIERENLQKLHQLQSSPFSKNASPLIEGIRKRINEAEDSRVKLLKSMGKDASPEYAEAVDAGGAADYSGIALKSIDTPAQSSNGFGGVFSGISAPVGGALSSLVPSTDEIRGNEAPISDDSVIENLYDSADEKLNAIRKRVRKMSVEERSRRGLQYIDDICDIYRDVLIEKGAESLTALDFEIDKLKKHYQHQLDLDLHGIPNYLYKDPDYDTILKRIHNNRPPIADIVPGEGMDYERADSGHVNPKIGTRRAFSINCQSCVVVFEARERGYNVEVLPFKGPIFEMLARDPRLAWIDPMTGDHPNYISDPTKVTSEDYYNFIYDTVKQGQRYTIQFNWKGLGNSGHIVNLDRAPDGQLRIKDNQRGENEKSEWVGYAEIIDYLSKVKFKEFNPFGESISCVPELLRIDNMDFDYSIVNNIMKGVTDE